MDIFVLMFLVRICFRKGGGEGHATVLSDECVLRLAKLGGETVHGIDSIFCSRRRLRRRR